MEMFRFSSQNTLCYPERIHVETGDAFLVIGKQHGGISRISFDLFPCVECEDEENAGHSSVSGCHMMWGAITASDKKDKDVNSCVLWEIARGGEKTRMERRMRESSPFPFVGK